MFIDYYPFAKARLDVTKLIHNISLKNKGNVLFFNLENHVQEEEWVLLAGRTDFKIEFKKQ